MKLIICIAVIVASVGVVLSCQLPPYQDMFKWDDGFICNKKLASYMNCSDPYLDPYVRENFCAYPASQIGYVLENYPAERADLNSFVKYYRGLNNNPNFGLRSGAKWECRGLCDTPAEKLETVFYTEPNGQQQICWVVQPQEIYFKRCSYQSCNMFNQIPDVTDINHVCVPESIYNIDVILYCPYAVVKQCVKTRLQVPLSCDCKRVECPLKPMAGGPLSGPIFNGK
ncbi:hypothetical protein ACJMK2_029840 [Sinanodonta woodiana]|uniref:Uncharacterized protein n=1 Tax=Sinanodonta woodiana TaxID=1069815 RepID=A0ABD3XDD2_SINWO